ncbi:DUF3293 domain-containing protein [Sansalvadorimonas verongulae]|uniref:DUF3293 domain-containing protein n=1 Tax=Sansalvadorimonas verongulae TaxID=2172824 RepID=UPI0012BD3DC4|nr:DUF3293 domain-containing protein [Sansalvadorimonas verongulae]MTI13153.1 DUF3293 domain-containing protein [Sansalvadorimonas verongulae]
MSCQIRLKDAYMTTSYIAEIPESVILRIGENSLVLDSLLAELGVGSWAFITAWNPRSEELAPADNAFRHEQLIQMLVGFNWFPGKGVPDEGGWQPEQSVLVTGISRDRAVQIGRHFGQNAIVYGERGQPAELVWIEDLQPPVTVLHIPHSAYGIPDDLRPQILLSDLELVREQLSIVDAYTDELFALNPDEASPVRFPVSRLVLDPERFEEDSQEIMADHGYGVIYTKAPSGVKLRSAPSARERLDLLERYYRPHHRQLTARVDESQNANGQCLIIDCHSFPERPLPFELCQKLERADICLGTDDYHTPEWLVDEARRLFEEREYTVSVNEPFAGALVPMKFYQKDKAVLALMIELNRRLYMDEKTGEKNAGFRKLQTDVQEIIRQLTGVVVIKAG